eukprot:6278816-Prymnesium_polylepis.1
MDLLRSVSVLTSSAGGVTANFSWSQYRRLQCAQLQLYVHPRYGTRRTCTRACGSLVELTRGEKSDGSATRRPSSGQRPREKLRLPP